jgi:hypothetical protein
MTARVIENCRCMHAEAGRVDIQVGPDSRQAGARTHSPVCFTATRLASQREGTSVLFQGYPKHWL